MSKGINKFLGQLRATLTWAIVHISAQENKLYYYYYHFGWTWVFKKKIDIKTVKTISWAC